MQFEADTSLQGLYVPSHPPLLVAAGSHVVACLVPVLACLCGRWASSMLRVACESRFGQEFSEGYLKLRWAQWNEYQRSMSPWEVETTLDC